MDAAAKQQKVGSSTSFYQSSTWKSVLRYKSLYFFLLPGMAFFIIFAYMPMYGILTAFKSYRGSLGIMGSPWIGLENFRLIWENADFWRAFFNTLEISTLRIVFGFPVPIVLSILLNELNSNKLKRVLNTIFTFPHFISWVIISGILMSLFSNNGAITNLIVLLGGERSSLLTQNELFRVLLIATERWKESGWGCIMYMAAIAGIDPSLYEGAIIDGANRWHKILYITWPGMKSMAAILLVLAIGNIMNSGFDQIFNMMNPAVQSSADIIDTYIYRQSFQAAGNFGYTTAVGLFKGVINCIFLLSARYITQKLGQETLY